ncbi:MAG: caspase family protein [Pseudomonadota bacterium]
MHQPLLAALCVAWAASSPVIAANYALVIGIDDYESIADLQGAKNDATLIAEALQTFGVSDLRVLLDQEATYDSIRSAWNDLLSKAQSGDTLIFTYSGHGARIADENGDEASRSQPDDVTDEMFVFSSYNEQTSEGKKEKLIDDELHQWFLAAGEKDVQVLFVADSCFSGTITRGGRARFFESLLGLGPDIRRKPLENMRETEEETIENVVFMAGSREAEPVLEVLIDNRYHGALSYSFARALSMAADLDQDGALSRDELSAFIPRTAQSFNGARHLPELSAVDGPDFAVLVPDETGWSDPNATWDYEGTAQAELPQASTASALPSAPGASWDPETGNITDAMGETIAYGVDENRLTEVNDKFALLNLLREGVVQSGTDLSIIVEGAPWHRELTIGTGFQIQIGPLKRPYMTVFNLANNGEVQLVYPIDRTERRPLPLGETITFDAEASEPLGSDELIVILTDEEPADLRQALKWALPASEFSAIVTRLLAQGGASFGHFSIVTQDQ